MPKSKNPKINLWRRIQRFHLRVVERAKERHAKRVVKRHLEASNALTRKIRHERKVITIRPSQSGWVWFDGKQVAPWIAEELSRARASGVWKGGVNSGRRDSALQARLYYGAPANGLIRGVTVAAPGTSNHERGPQAHEGAVDVSDYEGLRRYVHTHPSNLKAYLDVLGWRDPVHFSNTGH